MAVGTLVICLSKGDPRIGERVFAVLNGLEGVHLVTYWSGRQLDGYEGGGNHPLVLVAHATGTRITTQCATSGQHVYALERSSGNEVTSTLLQRGLRTKTYPFCLIAGCQAASQRGISGLYASVGDLLQIPVVASTTPVSLGVSMGVLTSSTTGGGEWKVFFPLGPGTGEVVSLNAPQCSGIRDTLNGLQHWLHVG